MTSLFSLIRQKKVIVSDGAWGTMLQDNGLPVGECPEAWNVSHPDVVKSIPEAYIEAGAEVVLTNSFGGSPLKLAKYGLEKKAAEYNFAAAQISKQAAQGKALVLASVGPTGQFLAPLGTISETEMIENFKIQIKSLSDGGADAILIETMSDLQEAVCAVKAAREVSELPVIVTMTFEKGQQGYRTMMGVSIDQAVEVLSEHNVDLLGTNCGNGIQQIVEIIRKMRQLTDKYLVAHPNAGLPEIKDGKTVFNQTPEEMAKYVPDLFSAGANIIGGCCGTNPEHIRLIARQIKSYRNLDLS